MVTAVAASVPTFLQTGAVFATPASGGAPFDALLAAGLPVVADDIAPPIAPIDKPIDDVAIPPLLPDDATTIRQPVAGCGVPLPSVAVAAGPIAGEPPDDRRRATLVQAVATTTLTPLPFRTGRTAIGEADPQAVPEEPAGQAVSGRSSVVSIPVEQDGKRKPVASARTAARSWSPTAAGALPITPTDEAAADDPRTHDDGTDKPLDERIVSATPSWPIMVGTVVPSDRPLPTPADIEDGAPRLAVTSVPLSGVKLPGAADPITLPPATAGEVSGDILPVALMEGAAVLVPADTRRDGPVAAFHPASTAIPSSPTPVLPFDKQATATIDRPATAGMRRTMQDTDWPTVVDRSSSSPPTPVPSATRQIIGVAALRANDSVPASMPVGIVETGAAPRPSVTTAAPDGPTVAPLPPSRQTPTTVFAVAAPSFGDRILPTVGAAGPAARVFGAAIAASGARRRSADEAAQPALAAAAVSGAPAATTAVADDARQAPLDMTHARWPQTMIERIEHLRDRADAADTRIRLVPDALGSIDVAVRREGDTLHVRFRAEQADTAALIRDAQPRLAAAAEERGLTLGRSAVDAGASGGQPHAQSQPQARPSAATPASRPAPAAAPSTDTDTDAATSGRLA